MQKLLVVDDNTTIQRVIKLAFKDEAIRVVTVPRGRSAFEQIEADPPDIILADNGREVASFLKEHSALSHIPVVLLKGAFDPATDEPDEAVGCADVLMKPLQPRTMIERVKRLLLDRKPAGGISPFRVPAPSIPSAVRAAPAGNPEQVDPALELGQYFDRLSAAFSRTENVKAQAPPDAGWLYPVRSNRDGLPSSNTPRTEQSPAPGVAMPGMNPLMNPLISDELVEQVTQRVLDRLGDRVVRSTATELVARLSKWLIVDEVERTKKAK